MRGWKAEPRVGRRGEAVLRERKQAKRRATSTRKAALTPALTPTGAAMKLAMCGCLLASIRARWAWVVSLPRCDITFTRVRADLYGWLDAGEGVVTYEAESPGER